MAVDAAQDHIAVIGKSSHRRYVARVCQDHVKHLAQHGERQKSYHHVQGRVFVAYFGRSYDGVRFHYEDAADDSASGSESTERNVVCRFGLVADHLQIRLLGARYVFAVLFQVRIWQALQVLTAAVGSRIAAYYCLRTTSRTSSTCRCRGTKRSKRSKDAPHCLIYWWVVTWKWVHHILLRYVNIVS